MWEIIERGDREREKFNLTIDGEHGMYDTFVFIFFNVNLWILKESENKIMTYCYTTLNKPLRQTEKQRESSLIAERKFSKRNPLTEKRYDIKVNSEFSQNVMMNRYMIKTANFNTLNTIPDYDNSMSEVILKHKRAA